MPATMNQTVNGNAVHNVEWRWDPLQNHNVWVAPRPYYAPRNSYAPGNSQWGRSHAPWYGNSNWGNYRYSPPGHRYYYGHPGYWHR